MIQDNYTTLQNIKQQELYYTHKKAHVHTKKAHTHTHTNNNNNNANNIGPNLKQSKTSFFDVLCGMKCRP